MYKLKFDPSLYMWGIYPDKRLWFELLMRDLHKRGYRFALPDLWDVLSELESEPEATIQELEERLNSIIKPISWKDIMEAIP